jgi:sugar phosphate isomerase/epimerase
MARISVSAMSSPSWTLDQDLSFYAAQGITDVGLSLRKLESAGLDAAVRRVRDCGVRVTNLLGLGFDLTDRQRWAAHQERLAAALEAAESVGAECFVLTTGTARSLTWEEAADCLQDALAPLVAAATALHLPLALEHTNSLRVDVGFVHTLRDMVALARSLGVGVVMECNACWAERALATTIAEGADLLRLVQVSDYVIGTLCTPDRAVPGDGDIPLARMLGLVRSAGYDGVFDLELMGPRIEAEGYELAIPRAISALSGLLAAPPG